MRPPRLTFYVMHLLGVGHIHRVRRLVDCMVRRGISVDIIYGGSPITPEKFATSEVHYLPPISARDATYSEYVDSSGTLVTPEYLESRRRSLLDYFSTLETDVLVTEMFPFGRRIVRDEILALLSEARGRSSPPLVISSVRDILETRKLVRHEESLQTIHDYYDYVLVHSDSGLIGFNETFPFTDEIHPKIFYTGFVCPPSSSGSSTSGSYDIIVSAGGGGFGYELLTSALQVSRREEWSSMNWCISMGSEMESGHRESLTSKAPTHVTLVERLDNLTDYIKNSKLSISQCGYNTAMDVLSACSTSDCRAVFVPYDVSGQTEQLRRSELLSSSGFGVHLPHSALTPDTLSSSMSDCLSLPRPEVSVDLDGADRTTKIILDLLDSDTESDV